MNPFHRFDALICGPASQALLADRLGGCLAEYSYALATLAVAHCHRISVHISEHRREVRRKLR